MIDFEIEFTAPSSIAIRALSEEAAIELFEKLAAEAGWCVCIPGEDKPMGCSGEPQISNICRYT